MTPEEQGFALLIGAKRVKFVTGLEVDVELDEDEAEPWPIPEPEPGAKSWHDKPRRQP